MIPRLESFLSSVRRQHAARMRIDDKFHGKVIADYWVENGEIDSAVINGIEVEDLDTVAKLKFQSRQLDTVLQQVRVDHQIQLQMNSQFNGRIRLEYSVQEGVIQHYSVCGFSHKFAKQLTHAGDSARIRRR